MQDKAEILSEKLLALEQRVAHLERCLSKLQRRPDEATDAQTASGESLARTYIAPYIELIMGEQRTELRILSPKGEPCIRLVAGWLGTLWGKSGEVGVLRKQEVVVSIHGYDEGGFVEFFGDSASQATIRLLALAEVQEGGRIEFEPLVDGRFGFGIQSTANGGSFSLFMAITQGKFKGIDLYNTQEGMEVYFMNGVPEREFKLQW